MMINIVLTEDEFQLLIDNTRFSIAKDSRRLIKIDEEIEKTAYSITKNRSKKNSALLSKLFNIKNN